MNFEGRVMYAAFKNPGLVGYGLQATKGNIK